MLPSRWLLFALFTSLSWGVWGAVVEIPEKAGFPATLGYVVWALTLAPCGAIAMQAVGWRISGDRRTLALAVLAGAVGAAGQLSLFEALRTGPAFIVFPVASLYPVVAVALGALLLRERASRRQAVGIAIAIPAVVLLSWVEPGAETAGAGRWLVMAAGVCVGWGVQAYLLKRVADAISAEVVFACLGAGGVLLIPIALLMTDFAQPINWGWRGPWLAALFHLLNAAGGLTYVYALRDGKAIIVVPIAAMSPVVTILLSIALYGRLPSPVHAVGITAAVIAMWLLAE